MSQTVLTITDSKTDTVYYPRETAEDTTGTDLVFNSDNDPIPIEIPVDGLMTITVADNTTGETVVAYITMEVF